MKVWAVRLQGWDLWGFRASGLLGFGYGPFLSTPNIRGRLRIVTLEGTLI